MSFPRRLFSLKYWLLTGLLVTLAAVLLVAALAWDALTRPMTPADAQIDFSVYRGESFARVAHRLEAEGIVAPVVFLNLYARLSGKAAMIKAGEFRIQGAVSAIDILDLFISGRVRQHQLTIVEGWSFQQLRAALEAADNLLIVNSADLDAAALMAAIGHPGVHPEGQFMPDTYSFPLGTSDLDFLRRAYQAMQDYLATVWEERDREIAIASPYEALILASIVEKETAVASERAQIAGVFMSRLRLNMRLQTDPTVIYGMGDSYDGNIRRKNLHQDTPYNTYRRHGLPPTPIAMPGRASIDAVLHPTATDALYFVSRGDGTHQFSPTLREHEAAVTRYQRKGRSR